MDSSEGLKRLDELYQGKEWFHSTGLDQFGRYVVYVTHMNHETLYDILDDLDGKQVLVHFAGSKTATASQFRNDGNARPNFTYPDGSPCLYDRSIDVSAVVLVEPTVDDLLGPEEEEKSIQYLQKELDKLERQCGSYTLQNIFYEVHDGKNAVTSDSERYPEVRHGMERLFKLYGFDTIYEELDG